MNYALIENETVVNIIVLDPEGARYFPGAILIPEGYSVSIGDTYTDGRFCHEGQPIEPLPSPDILSLSQDITGIKLDQLGLSKL